MRSKKVCRSFVCCLLTAWIALGGLHPYTLLAQDENVDLKIVILEGDGGVNIVKKKTAVLPVVEVRDKNNNPVAGASVSFLTPTTGPSATFANGARTLSMVTDSSGRAAVTAMKPVGSGPFKIGVTAHKEGHGTASAGIAQTNLLAAAVAGTAAISTAVIIGGVVVAGGVVATAAVLAKGDTTAPIATISPGP